MRHTAPGFLAPLHVLAAGVCADATMIVFARMLVTFVRAKPAGGCAGVEHSADHFVV